MSDLQGRIDRQRERRDTLMRSPKRRFDFELPYSQMRLMGDLLAEAFVEASKVAVARDDDSSGMTNYRKGQQVKADNIQELHLVDPCSAS